MWVWPWPVRCCNLSYEVHHLVPEHGVAFPELVDHPVSLVYLSVGHGYHLRYAYGFHHSSYCVVHGSHLADDEGLDPTVQQVHENCLHNRVVQVGCFTIVVKHLRGVSGVPVCLSAFVFKAHPDKKSSRVSWVYRRRVKKLSFRSTRSIGRAIVRHKGGKGVHLINFNTRGAKKLRKDGDRFRRYIERESTGKMVEKDVVVALTPKIGLMGVVCFVLF